MDNFTEFGTCRCCLTTSDQISLMSEVQFFSENEPINASQSYLELTGLSKDLVPEDSLKICLACKTQLETTFAFRKTCLESHNVLITCIKEEPDEEIVCDSEVFAECTIKTEPLRTPSPAVKQRKTKVKKATKTRGTRKPYIKKNIDQTVLKSLPLASDSKGLSIDFMPAKFVCMFCDVPAKNYAHLIKHRKNHRMYEIRDCKMCGDTECKDYEAHVAQVHPEYRPQQCLHCDATYINHKELKQHLLTHKTAERYQCLACLSNFDSQMSLRIHISSRCSIPTHVAYRCHVCGLVIGKLAEVQQHIFEKHPKDFQRRYYPCYVCKKIFTGTMTTAICKPCKSGIKTKANNKLADVQCEKCDKKFINQEAYECHKIGNHSSQSYCFECDIAFWTIAEKRAHNKVHHPIYKIRRERMCDECGKVFLDDYHLKIHMLMHQGKPQFKCTHPGCESATYSKDRLRSHIRNAHQKDYKYECHYCGKRINFWGYIFTHFTRAHFPHLRKYGCDVNTCTRRFASITDKKRHMVTHTGEKLPAKKQKVSSGGQERELQEWYPQADLQ